jgi:hypothetical protein
MRELEGFSLSFSQVIFSLILDLDHSLLSWLDASQRFQHSICFCVCGMRGGYPAASDHKASGNSISLGCIIVPSALLSKSGWELKIGEKGAGIGWAGPSMRVSVCRRRLKVKDPTSLRATYLLCALHSYCNIIANTKVFANNPRDIIPSNLVVDRPSCHLTSATAHEVCPRYALSPEPKPQ